MKGTHEELYNLACRVFGEDAGVVIRRKGAVVEVTVLSREDPNVRHPSAVRLSTFGTAENAFGRMTALLLAIEKGRSA